MEGRIGLPKGTLLEGEYRIERLIGSGGFGITYEAEDVRLRARVAIKEYYPAEFGDRDTTLSVTPRTDSHRQTFAWGRASFLEEAQTLVRFKHPSIVRVTRVFEANATAYMVMDFEEGPDLDAWLRALGRPPSQDELDRIAAPLLDALELMHASDFLHRDIAPDNIIIRADGTPVLLDFGSARRAVAAMTRTLTGIVKAGYSPLEQYGTETSEQGPWTDIYALGGTLYRAVTGIAPHEAPIRSVRDLVRPATEVAVGAYRPDFLAAIDACLALHPAQRPRSIAELRPMLLGSRHTRRMTVPTPVSRPGAGRMPLTRRWTIRAVSALVIVGGLYAGWQLSEWLSHKRQAERELALRAQTLAAEERRKAREREQREAEAREQAERRRRAEEERARAMAAEAAAWGTVKDTLSIPALEAFIDRHPRGAFAELARERIAELREHAAAEEERARQAEAEARWRAEQEAARRERERRQAVAAMQAPIDNVFAAWRSLDVEAYVAQWVPGAVKVDLKARTARTIEQLAVERRRLFPQLERVDADYGVQFRGLTGGTAHFDVSYRLTFHYRNGRTTSESACEGYEVEMRDGDWLIARNEDYKPCS